MVPASIVYEPDPCVYVARVVSLPGCVSQGTSREEAKKNLASALVDILKLHAKRGTQPEFQEPNYQVELSTLSNVSVDVEEDS